MTTIKRNLTFDQFTRAALTPVRDPGRCASRQDLNDWAGGSWDDATRLLTTGWSQGLERVVKLAEGLTASFDGQVSAYALRYDVSGAYPDVARYVNGEPENMVDFEPTTTAGNRIIKLIVSLVVSARIDTQTIERKGAAIMALVDLLELSGHDVELVGNFHQHKGEDHWEADITLKQSGEYIERDRLIYALAHPSFLRRLGFSLMEQEESKFRKKLSFHTGGGYGRILPPTADANITITTSSKDFATDQTARDWIIKQLQEQGGTLS